MSDLPWYADILRIINEAWCAGVEDKAFDLAAAVRTIESVAQPRRPTPEPQGEVAELMAGLKDPTTVHVWMMRGLIAIPTWRSLVDLRGEVPNGEDAQLSRIAELQERLAEPQPGEGGGEDVRFAIYQLEQMAQGGPLAFDAAAIRGAAELLRRLSKGGQGG